MSYTDERDDFDQNQNDPGSLRKAIDKANKEKAAAEKALADLQREVSEIKLGNILAERKVPAALQRLMKKEGVEPTAEAVDKWLSTDGADFGWNPQAASTEKPEGQQSSPQEAPAVQQSVLTEEDVAGLGRITGVTTGGNGQFTASDQAEQAVQAAASVLTGGRDDFDKLMAAFREQGIPIESSFG